MKLIEIEDRGAIVGLMRSESKARQARDRSLSWNSPSKGLRLEAPPRRKTRSVFDRSNIIGDTDIAEAAATMHQHR
jgi:hypothetical protein